MSIFLHNDTTDRTACPACEDALSRGEDFQNAHTDPSPMSIVGYAAAVELDEGEAGQLVPICWCGHTLVTSDEEE